MKNSLAEMRPKMVTEWSPRNLPIRTEEISYGSKKIYWWKSACGYEWEASVKARSQGRKCPFCAGKRIILGVDDLAGLMPELAAEWSEKNPIPATAVGIGSHKKVIWHGKCGHEYHSGRWHQDRQCIRIPHCGIDCIHRSCGLLREYSDLTDFCLL